jgi:cellulose synthase/poly-beta-1,6-N-acetylglucosamine synthase-like glycosyltransferase
MVFFVALILIAVPVTVLLVQVIAALPARGAAAVPSGTRPRVAVLVPAHDEASIIVPTLDRILRQLGPQDRLLVVADNCSDDTALLAAQAGAEVVERFDAEQRGKGFALAFGIDKLGEDPPEVLIIIDADCDIVADSISRLAIACASEGRPVQGLCLMKAPAGSGLGLRLAEFAWLVKNFVRQTGNKRLGMPCQLAGTGMAFPWVHVRSISMATSHIAEDMLIGVRLALAGAHPVFCPDALLSSDFPASGAGERSQRRRWEHGHLSLILTEAPVLLATGLVRRDPRLCWMALDLGVPPLALLALAIVLLVLAAAIGAFLTGAMAALWASVAVLCMFAAAVLLAWFRHGRSIIGFGELAFAPVYVLRKVALYASFLTRRQVDWIKTRRDP